MSALDGLKKFLHISPSVVFPEDVWPYVEEAEEEYDRLESEYAECDRECARLWDRIHAQDRQIEQLRDLALGMWVELVCKETGLSEGINVSDEYWPRMVELGIEVDA